MSNILDEIERLTKRMAHRGRFKIHLINEDNVLDILREDKRINKLKTLRSRINFFHQSLYSSSVANDTICKISFILSKYLNINYSIIDVVALVNARNLLEKDNLKLNQESFMLNSEIAKKLAKDIKLSIVRKESANSPRTIYCNLDFEDLKYKYLFLKKILGERETKVIMDAKVQDGYAWMKERKQFTPEDIIEARDRIHSSHITAFDWSGEFCTSCFKKPERSGCGYDYGTSGEFEKNYYLNRNNWLSDLNIKIENSLIDRSYSETDANDYRFTDKILLTYGSVEEVGLDKIYKNVLILDAISLRVIDSTLELITTDNIENLIKKEINKCSYKITKTTNENKNEIIFEIEDSVKIKHARSIVEKLSKDARFSFKRVLIKHSVNKNKIKILVVGFECGGTSYVRAWEDEFPPKYAKEITKYLGALKFHTKTSGGWGSDLYHFEVTLPIAKEIEAIDSRYEPLTRLKVDESYVVNEDIEIGNHDVTAGSTFIVTKVGRDWENHTKMILLSGKVRSQYSTDEFKDVELFKADKSLEKLELSYDPYHGDIPNCDRM